MRNKQLVSYSEELGTWAKPLAHVLASKQFSSLMETIEIFYNSSTIYPERANIFKAFRDCPYDKLQLVILGRDPYCNGRDTGVAFANSDVENISPELECLYESIYGGAYREIDSIDVSLENLSNQGVLFLNPILTVQENLPLSHWGLWNKFTMQVLEVLSKEKQMIIYSFLGNIALSFKQFVDVNHNVILEYSHPTDALINNQIWICPHFKRLNFILDRFNKQIIW